MTNTATPLPAGHLDRFFVHQKVTAMVNRFQILAPGPDGNPGDRIAFAEQKRLKLKEEIDFFTDATKSEPMCFDQRSS